MLGTFLGYVLCISPWNCRWGIVVSVHCLSGGFSLLISQSLRTRHHHHHHHHNDYRHRHYQSIMMTSSAEKGKSALYFFLLHASVSPRPLADNSHLNLFLFQHSSSYLLEGQHFTCSFSRACPHLSRAVNSTTSPHLSPLQQLKKLARSPM